MTSGPEPDAGAATPGTRAPAEILARRRRDTRKVAALAAVLVTLAAFALSFARVATIDRVAQPDRSEHVFVSTYEPPASALEQVITVADGQAWAALAQDPTFSHPEVFTGGTAEFVYRAQRPLFGLLVWAASGGQADAVAIALVVLSGVGVGALAFASTLLADQQGRVRRYAWIAALLPGSILVAVVMGPESLAVAAAVMGVYWWSETPRRLVPSVLALVAAALMRDTLVLVPVAIVAWELVHNRRPVRQLIPLAIPPLALFAWIVHLRIRWGYWSNQASSGRGRLDLPFRGWIGAIPEVELVRTGSFVLAAVLLGVALVRHRDSVLTWIAVAFALSTVLLGVEILATESYRPLLAMYVFALIAVLPADRSRRGAEVQRARLELADATT